MAFDDNKVMWTTSELLAGSAADRVYEAAAAYVTAHQPFKLVHVPGLLLEIGKQGSSILEVVRFVFEGGLNKKAFIDRVKDIVVMLERDNAWLDK